MEYYYDLEWWGYLHTNGTIQVKRFFDDLDLQDAHESPFVERVFPPFKAKNRDDAIRIIMERVQKEKDKR